MVEPGGDELHAEGQGPGEQLAPLHITYQQNTGRPTHLLACQSRQLDHIPAGTI